MFNHFNFMISTDGHLTILESVDSTNNYAMAQVRTGLAKHGDGFFAMAQTMGRGQRGKTWVTEPGTNIILTLVLQPLGLHLSQQFSFNMAVALAVHDFFAHCAGHETTIKWPNDIYWRDRKAGGILIENVVVSRDLTAKGQELTIDDSEFTTGSWSWAIVGMGININQAVFPAEIRNVVSLKQITGKDWDVIELAKELSSCVQQRYQQLLSGENFLAEYNSHLFKKGQSVKFKKESRVFEATVKGVNAGGQLVAITSIEEHFAAGELEWILQ